MKTFAKKKIMAAVTALAALCFGGQPVLAESVYIFRYNASGAVTAQDSPNPFSFSPLINQDPGTQVVSNAVSIGGLTKPATVTMGGGEFTTDSGASWLTTGTVENGNSLKLRGMTASAYNEAKTYTVRVGSYAASWSVKTGGMPSPDAFNFTNLSSQLPSTVVQSNIVTLTGFQGSLPVSVTADASAAAAVSINGGTWVTSGQISANQTLQVRATSSAANSSTQNVIVAVGPLTKAWSIGTQGVQNPSAFSFNAVSGVAPSSSQQSDTVTLSGFTGSLTATVSGDASANAKMRVNNGPWVTTASVSAGNTIQLTGTAANTVNSSSDIAVSVGSVSATWTIQTWPQQNPTAFTFTDLSNQEPGLAVTSNVVTLSGFLGKLTASMTADSNANAKMRINGGAWVDGGDVSAGDTLQLRASVPSAVGGSYDIPVVIGDISDTWTVSAWAAQNAAAFNFDALTDQEPGTRHPSNQVVLSGFLGNLPVSLNADPSAAAQFSINGGSWATTGNVKSGDSLQLVATASVNPDTSQNVMVSVGSTSGTWNLKTWPQQAPTAFSFNDQTDLQTDDVFLSNVVTVAGFLGSLPVTISSDASANAKFRINGGTYTTTGSVKAGDTLQLQATTSKNGLTTVNTIVSVGSVSDTWSLQTWPTQHPNAFTIGDAIATAPSQDVFTQVNGWAQTVTLSGFRGKLLLTMTGPGTPFYYVSKDGGATLSEQVRGGQGYVVAGDTIIFCATSAADGVSVETINVTLGGYSTSFKVRFQGKVVYTAATTGTSWTVPTGVTSITVMAWGAGGGAGNATGAGATLTKAGAGGGGGYTKGKFPVTPGSQLTVVVGAGGRVGALNGVTGTGGGYSGLFNGSTAIVVAGGGGGGGGGYGTASQGGAGGAGGGALGGTGGKSSGTYANGAGGTGGWQTAGGNPGTLGTAGSYLTGGSVTNGSGGGGGAGYYGGGAGGSHQAASPYYAGGGGGGGATYDNVSNQDPMNTQAVGSTPGNVSDPERLGNAGYGSTAGGVASYPGQLVIIY